MDSDNQDELRKQVEVLRGYADQGRSLPIVSGPVFIVWGLVLAGAGWLARTALLRGDSASVPWIWVGAIALGWTASMAIKRMLRLRAREGGASYGNHLTRVIWRAAGLVISAYVLLAILVKSRQADIPSVALLISGVAFFATAAAANSRILYVAGAGLIGTGLLAIGLHWGAADVQLAVAAAGLLFLALPGFYLVLNARSSD
ncbi:MAG TPA: hypothetical protein VE053_04495 [Allosphingosinicella sp.]|nr:hypothetical protein [Allosphingosinicella sp.]